jgi:hypothetical protein
MEKTNIYQKLLKVQEEVGKIKKTEANPFFKSMYFDVNGLLAALKPVLSKHGLVLIQPLAELNGHLALNTILADAESGDSVRAMTILPDVNDAQKQGSAITYFRRYALQSFFALEAVDDDGNSVSQPVNTNPRTAYQKKAEQRRQPKFQENLDDTQIDIEL